jgi:hypothetical protein
VNDQCLCREKAERINDPNVEYVDVDDYKPGGKYGPPVKPVEQPQESVSEREELKKASELLASSLSSKVGSHILSMISIL